MAKQFTKGYKALRYFDIVPFGDNIKRSFYFCVGALGDSVVDDSHYRPNVNLIRTAIDSGQVFQEGVYDFDDGKDNGYMPQLRKISPDPVEVDQAVSVIKESAKKFKQIQDEKEVLEAQKSRDEKIAKGLEALGDFASQSDSSSESES